MAETRLVLASSSPRRRELLARIGVVAGRIESPDIDESPLKGELPRAYAPRLAEAKAREEARRKVEEQLSKSKEPPKPLPEFGSTEDFPLQQALNQSRGLPVVASKTVTERQAEAAEPAKR